MLTVKILHKSATEVMELVRELRQQGLVQGHDFDFAFNQAQYNTDGHEAVIPRHTVFTFYVEKYATFFALKYSV